jgi:F-type H+-transporting ATPase subunit gamma
MSQRRALEQHRTRLGEMRTIMNSMKALAYMESRKLTNFSTAQRAVVQSIEAAAGDFLYWHPDLRRSAPPSATEICVVIGAARGFCGDFNETLVRNLAREPELSVIAVGHKLGELLVDDPRVVATLDGASVAEEVASILGQLATTLAERQRAQGEVAITVLAHRGQDDDITRHALLPPFRQLPAPARIPPRPLLYLSPAAFYRALVEQYVFSVLNEFLYASLLAENLRRVNHLDHAVRHLDEKVEAMKLRSNALRQEEITEEIEVILLGIDSRIAQWRHTARRPA